MSRLSRFALSGLCAVALCASFCARAENASPSFATSRQAHSAASAIGGDEIFAAFDAQANAALLAAAGRPSRSGTLEARVYRRENGEFIQVFDRRFNLVDGQKEIAAQPFASRAYVAESAVEKTPQGERRERRLDTVNDLVKVGVFALFPDAESKGALATLAMEYSELVKLEEFDGGEGGHIQLPTVRASGSLQTVTVKSQQPTLVSLGQSSCGPNLAIFLGAPKSFEGFDPEAAAAELLKATAFSGAQKAQAAAAR